MKNVTLKHNIDITLLKEKYDKSGEDVTKNLVISRKGNYVTDFDSLMSYYQPIFQYFTLKKTDSNASYYV